MGNTALFYLVIITAGSIQAVLPHYSCSDVRPSPNNSNSSGMGDLQEEQVSASSYCITDNCTIMRIDTGETLDIIYTTNSSIVVTPTNGQTSVIVSKDNIALSCILPSVNDEGQLIQIAIRLLLTILIAVMSSYIFWVHLLFKKAGNVFGRLLMFHSGALIFKCINGLILVSFHFLVALNSQAMCQIIMFSYMQGIVGYETFATCILSFLAYLMYSSYNLRKVTKQIAETLFKKCVTYAFGALALLSILIVCYDYDTANYKYLLLPDGHCALNDVEIYNTLIVTYSFASLNKFLQITAFIIYLYYFSRYMAASRVAEVSTVKKQLNKKLVKIAFVFGAAVGLAQFTWILGNISGYRSYGRLVGGFFLLLQQSALVINLIGTKKLCQFCKKSSKIQPSA